MLDFILSIKVVILSLDFLIFPVKMMGIALLKSKIIYHF